MMRLRALRRPSKKPLLILSGIVVATVALASGAWWFNANRAANEYRTQLTNHAAAAQKELAGIGQEFKELSAQNDSKKSIQAMVKLEETLTRQSSGLPKLPELFGVSLVPGEDAHRRDELLQRYGQFNKDVKAARELLAYQEAAATILQEVTIKTGPNAVQQKALADAWAAMADKLKALTAPSEAAGIHQQIITAAAAAQSVLAALPDLFNKKDVNGFAAKQKEIEGHINELRAQGDSMQVLNANHDKAIVRDYQKLQEMLK